MFFSSRNEFLRTIFTFITRKKKLSKTQKIKFIPKTPTMTGNVISVFSKFRT